MKTTTAGDGAYRDDKGPVEGVIDELCTFLRDHHSGQTAQIDVGVIDFLADVLDAVGQTSVGQAYIASWQPEIRSLS